MPIYFLYFSYYNNIVDCTPPTAISVATSHNIGNSLFATNFFRRRYNIQCKNLFARNFTQINNFADDAATLTLFRARINAINKKKEVEL